MKAIKLLLLTLLFLGCTDLTPPPKAPQEPSTPLVLYWTNTTEPHPEREPWTKQIEIELTNDLALYSASKDITQLCPKFHSLNDSLKIKGIGEFWVALAYYESGFNPKSYSVDVGNQNNKETWSVGLYQLSGTDGPAKLYGATFEKLKDPVLNIKVAAETMRRQLKNTNTILLDNSSKNRYWAVALHGNKYSKIPEIKARVLKHAPSCK